MPTRWPPPTTGLAAFRPTRACLRFGPARSRIWGVSTNRWPRSNARSRPTRPGRWSATTRRWRCAPPAASRRPAPLMRRPSGSARRAASSTRTGPPPSSKPAAPRRRRISIAGRSSWTRPTRSAMEALTRLEIEYRGGDTRLRPLPAPCDGLGDGGGVDRSGPHAGRQQSPCRGGRRGPRGHGGNRHASRSLLLFTAFAEGISGDAAAALDEIAPLAIAESPPGLAARAQLALRARQFCAGRRALAERYNQTAHDTDQIGWSILSLAWRMLGDPREQWLCDYDRLVMVTEVPSPDGRTGAGRIRQPRRRLRSIRFTRAAPRRATSRFAMAPRPAATCSPGPTRPSSEFRQAVIDRRGAGGGGARR